MKESDGLTARGEHVYFVTKTPEELKNESSRADRLAAYENTGLSPEEVEKLKDKVYSTDEVNHLIAELNAVMERLKAENAELRAKVEGAPELEFQIGDIAYYIEFAFCDGYDEQDEMTHDVEFYVCQKRLDTECERLHACGDYLEQKAFKSKKAAKEAAEARLKELEASHD